MSGDKKRTPGTADPRPGRTPGYPEPQPQDREDAARPKPHQPDPDEGGLERKPEHGADGD
ncbi:hypothetical protein ABIE09_000195 [Lysobacter enzymogenes]|jgi:hypothetical protein|uniref:Uncharacterized protein n=1 Tax=Lysobacter enzymogenes TaxID=69 RepID=A0AAU9AM50_LYSEN|nr:hypothetical protein [Lysobacter enzymogenes]BAV97193.1 conserved hypothetical protein [Lysobacter enzymogenes]SDX01842.1 hypothetical protein SAMN05421681_103503 [Lysobacter enzymogenes]